MGSTDDAIRYGASGAGLGTMLGGPGIGTAIGAGLGAGYGALFGGGMDNSGPLRDSASAASQFADQGQRGFAQWGQDARGQLAALRALQLGQNSISAQQLRQSLQQNLAAQQSMAAGASPQNAVMAARVAANNAARMGSGLAGQQAVAGIQERNQATMALNDFLTQQRQMELNAALQSRANALGAYGKYAGMPTAAQGDLSAVQGLTGLYAKTQGAAAPAASGTASGGIADWAQGYTPFA